MENEQIKPILEAALLAAGRPLSLNDFEQLFAGDADAPPRNDIRAALAELAEDWESRCLALQEVASGFRAQVRQEYEPWVARLWDEKPPRYSRALLETLAIIAYRQPITRSEIEDIRGVSVSTQIIRTLDEREWVRVVGHRETPGRPAMYGTTKQFLDHFNLKSLDQLPELSELEQPGPNPELGFEEEPDTGEQGEAASADTDAIEGEAVASDAAEEQAGVSEVGTGADSETDAVATDAGATDASEVTTPDPDEEAALAQADEEAAAPSADPALDDASAGDGISADEPDVAEWAEADPDDDPVMDEDGVESYATLDEDPEAETDEASVDADDPSCTPVS